MAKRTKASVDYSEGTPEEHCGICEHYRNGLCTKVQGMIDPEYWCDLFERRPDADEEEHTSLRDLIEDAVKGEPEIYLVRHGSTKMNRGGAGKDLIRGWADVPLSPEGIEQAERVARDLSDCDFSTIYCSSLQRAEATADMIADVTGGKVEPHDELKSWNLGPKFEGKLTNDKIVSQIKALVEDDEDRPEGGESFGEFVRRIVEFVEPIFAKARGEIAVVAHGRCLQIIALWIAADCDLECMQRDFAEELSSEPDSIAPGGYLELKKIAGKWRAMQEEDHQSEDRQAVSS